MLRIAINAVSTSPGGGLSVLLSLLETWVSSDSEVLLSVYASNPCVISALKAFAGKVETIPVCCGASPTKHFAFQQISLGPLIRAHRADVVLTTNHLVGRCTKPQAVHHQNLLRFEVPMWRSLLRGKLSDIVRDFYARRALRVASANVFISDFVRKKASHFVPGGGIRNPHIVYNGVYARDFPNLNQGRRKVGQLLAVQSDCSHKNGDVLVKTIKVLIELQPSIDWRLKIAGSGDWKSLERLASVERVSDRIEFLGFSDRNKLSNLYDSSSMLVFPSSVEGFGLPVVEAMIRSLPVVAANSTAIPEIAGDAALLVSSLSPIDYANAIISVETENAIRSSLIAKGLTRAKLFSHLTQAESMLSVLKSIA
jgi:glycosyltransferase involved in cell wall biosynthesis